MSTGRYPVRRRSDHGHWPPRRPVASTPRLQHERARWRTKRLDAGRGRTPGHAALPVVVQVALALVLLVSAGLLLRSLQHLFAMPPGFDPAELLTMQVQTAGQRFRDADTTHRFFNQVLEAVRQVPGVSAVAFTSQLPLTGDEGQWGVHLETVPRDAAAETNDSYRYAVSPGYFQAMGIPLRAGRALDSHDIAGAPLAAGDQRITRAAAPARVESHRSAPSCRSEFRAMVHGSRRRRGCHANIAGGHSIRRGLRDARAVALCRQRAMAGRPRPS